MKKKLQICVAYMPYLTLWDKISQNLAHLEANFHKIIQSQNFQTILQHILWRNKHKSHLVVFITSFLHLNKGFWLLWGSFKVIFVKISQNFIKSHLKFCLISQISVHSLWHVWCSLALDSVFTILAHTDELLHDKTNKMTCAPSEDSDQPGHLPSLIRAFAVCSMGN